MALKFERERINLESALSEINMIPLIDIMLVLNNIHDYCTNDAFRN